MIIPKQIAGLLARHAKQSRAVKVSPQGLALVQQFHDYQIEFRPARGVFGAETAWLSPLALPILKMGGDVQLINGGGRWSCELAQQPGGKPRKTSARVALPPGEVSQIMRDGRGGVRYGLDPVALLGALTSADKIAPGGDDKFGFIWLDSGEVLATDSHAATARPGGWYGHAFAPTLTAAITVEAARVWLAALAALTKTGGRWGIEGDGASLALVHDGDAGETRVAARIREPNIKSEQLRRVLATHAAGALPVVHLDADFVRRALKFFRHMAVYQNGAIFCWNDPSDTGISALLAGDVLWTGQTSIFLDLLPKRAAKDWPATIPVEVSGPALLEREKNPDTSEGAPKFIEGVLCCNHDTISTGGGNAAMAGRFLPYPDPEDMAPLYGIIRAA